MKMLLKLAYKFDLDQSERKSLQVNASARKGQGQKESEVDRSFQFASTRDSVSPVLKTKKR